MDQPRVSIGLPVYNGENFLEDTLNTLLSQTFTDFELIIADNASTDNTQAICQTYAETDKRIRYIRNETNIGAAKNYNLVFNMALGEYFKWNGHDDPLAPTYLERCVSVLDENPEVGLCFAKTRAIDEFGADKDLHLLAVRRYVDKPKLRSEKAYLRFYQCVVASYPPSAIFGLIRRNILQQTPLIGSYIASDRPLLGEISLHGKIYEIPEYLQYRRIHPQQLSWRTHKTRQAFEAWYDTNLVKKRRSPQWQLFQEHLAAIRRAAPNQTAKFGSYLAMVAWVIKYPLFWMPLRNLLRQGFLFLETVDSQKKIIKLLTRKQGST